MSNLALTKHRADLKDVQKTLQDLHEAAKAREGKFTEDENFKWQEALDRKNHLEAAIQNELTLIEVEQTLSAMPKEEAEAIDKEMNPAPKPQEKQLFASLGEQYLAIIQAITSKHQDVDPRLLEVNAAITGAGTAPLESGGYLIQTQFSKEIWQLMVDAGGLAQMCTKLPMGQGFNAIEIPMVRDTNRTDGNRFGGVTVYRAAEAGTVTATNMKFDKTRIESSKLMALSYLTKELMRDAVAVEGLTKNAVAQEFAVMLDEEIFFGNGGGGTCKGFMNSGSLVTVSAETNQKAATVVAQNIPKMFNRVWGKWRPNAVWVYNQEIEPEIQLMTLPIGTAGVPVYLPPAGFAGAPHGMLYGKPMMPHESAAALGTTGDLVLVDMEQYVLVEKEGLVVASSEHVRFLNDETVFRWTREVVGQPKYNEVITPKKGSNTYSAFVALATRS